MDIRNFKATIKAPTPTTLEAIFQLQKALLDRYIGVEKLPQYPIPIHDPGSQIIIKDFIARVTEELGEAFESYLKMFNQVNGDPKVFIPNLYNFNEEIADAIHFLVETCIFTGITVPMIISYTKQSMLILHDKMPNTDDAFELAYKVRPSLVSGFSNRYTLPEAEDNILIQGGRYFHESMFDYTSVMMWEVTYHLQLARNALKNKPWKQSHMASDENTFNNKIIEALLGLIHLCREVGINEEAFYNIYYAKNQVNHFRITSKY